MNGISTQDASLWITAQQLIDKGWDGDDEYCFTNRANSGHILHRYAYGIDFRAKDFPVIQTIAQAILKHRVTQIIITPKPLSISQDNKNQENPCTLFNLEAFQSLPVEDKQKMKILIENEDLQGVRDYVEALMEAKLLNAEELQNELKKLQYRYNFDTLLAQTIEELPKIKTVEPNESQTPLSLWKEIKLEMEKLTESFFGEKDLSLLDTLLETFAANRFTKINYDYVLMNKRNLDKRLESLSAKLRRDLHKDRSKEKILRQLVLDANATHLFGKQDYEVLTRTAELMKIAFEHIDKIKKKDTILFIGNTGSGKSTSVNFFLKAPLESYYNKVGEKVIRLKNNEVSEQSYPKIGASLAGSETVFAQGYPLSEADYILVDCPGFRDTRGGDYELCTHLSIDQAIVKSKSIRSLVLVLPIHSFTEDRATNAIEFLYGIRERFPKTFNPDQFHQNSRIFMLITKRNQAPNETVKNVRDGTRFYELLKEAQEQMKHLLECGVDIESFEMQSVKGHLNIWKTLHQMHTNGQIHLIDIDNKAQRENLLQRYSECTQGLDKEQYHPLMHCSQTQVKFRDHVKFSLDMWTNLIFKQYLQDIPEAIAKVKSSLRRKKDEVSLLISSNCGQEANEKLIGMKKEIEDEQIKLETLLRKSRNLAIHALLQKKSGELLKQFAGYVVDTEPSALNQGSSNEIVKSCRDFVRDFDKNFEKLKEQIKSIENFKVKID